jgi:hypothetical protein
MRGVMGTLEGALSIMLYFSMITLALACPSALTPTSSW